MTLRSLRSRSCEAFGPGWPPLRSSHLVALRATKAGPAARAGQRAFGPGTYRGGGLCGPVTGCQQVT